MKTEIPFIVGKTVIGEYFINRTDELARMDNMLSAISSGASSNVALIGLRRTGKTSLFENVRLRLMKMEQIVPVLFDCFEISTKTRFSRAFMQEVTHYIFKTRDRLYKERLGLRSYQLGISQGKSSLDNEI